MVTFTAASLISRSLRSRWRWALLGAMLLVPLTGMPAAADPVTVDINSVTGVWTSAAPPGVANGVGTNQISWGFPANGSQSSYSFVGVAPPPVMDVPLETLFDLGTFTHNNFPVFAPSITGAVLQVTTNLTVHDGFTLTLNVVSVFEFTHNETPNAAETCLPGSGSVCDDVVIFAINPSESDSFMIDGVSYLIDISGFLVGGNLVNSFMTLEDQSNTATMRGIVAARTTPTQVPVPPSLALVGIGVAVTALARARRRR